MKVKEVEITGNLFGAEAGGDDPKNQSLAIA
jgi:hypothetical protein